MNSSELYAQNHDLKIREKKNERNKKNREKFAGLSVEQKEAHRRKNREAYHRRKMSKLLSKTLDPQSVQPTKQCNIKPFVKPSNTNNDNNGVLMPQLIQQHLHDTVGIYNKSTLPRTSDRNATGTLTSNLQLPGSKNQTNTDDRFCVSYPGSKLKSSLFCFSTYEEGNSSATNHKHICSDSAPPHDKAESFMCMNCFKFLPQNIEDASELLAFATEYQMSQQCLKSIAKTHKGNKRSRSGKTQKSHTRGEKVPDGIEALKCISSEPDILAPKPDCSYCEAKKLYSETPNFCCSAGQIVLQENKLQDILIELYTGHSAEALSFRTYVRTYNNMFAFTSFGVHYDRSLCRRTNGIYTFKVQGQTYHFIKDLIPHECRTVYLQLYFHDTEHELENRLATSENLTESAVKKIMHVMESNPYASFLRSLKNVPNLDSYQIVLKSHSENDQRVWNQPTASQIAALWVEGQESGEGYKRHIQIYTKEGKDHLVHYYYGCYDPLQYPLLFPFGETGWHPGIKRTAPHNPNKRKRYNRTANCTLASTDCKSAEELIAAEHQASHNPENNKEFVSMREYYAYKLQMREKYTPGILNTGRLLQQYVIDMYIKIESQRLDYYRSRQQLIRREEPQGIMDSVISGHCQGSKIGQRVILPASFIGGPRDMRRRYVDAMALVQKFGKPDLFITMTCNPSWPEVKKHMLPTDEGHNRPDLLARVFHAKLDLLKDQLFKKQIFGAVAAYTYVVEFQKRGLPHTHFLIILEAASKLYSTESYDKIVSAEIPDITANQHLFRMVRKHMIHGPCEAQNPDNVCMQGNQKKRCINNYPKSFAQTTFHGKNAYPTYRRRNDGQKITVRGHQLDNRWIVPHNRYLLAKFDCHINVEICSTVKAVKYIYKYIYKGHDRIHFRVNSDALAQDNNSSQPLPIDEIKDFQSARWVCAVEAIWRVYRFNLSEIHPSVIHLQLHLQNCQSMSFTPDQDLRDVIRNKYTKRTMLTEFFYMNSVDELAQHLKCTYKEFPEHFVWYPGRKKWEPRKQKDCIGRIVTAGIKEGERYFLRLLLTHVKGPKSFEDLKTVNGTYVNTFREAAILRGYFESDTSQEECLEEASSYQMPYILRRLFATLLVHFPPLNARKLWEKFEHCLSEDFIKIPDISTDETRYKVLEQINNFLESMGRDINSYALVPYPLNFNDLNKSTRDTIAETRITVLESDLQKIDLLNNDQKTAFDIITHAVFQKKHGCFFVDGPGGTGKTFLYRALLAEARSKGFIALATASCGVAASILPGGRTAHSRFNIPLDTTKNKNCRISKQSSSAELLQKASLIIWDEAPMINKGSIEAVDRLLQDLMDSNALFGSKVIVFGGDFRQVLPVVPKGTKSEFIDASIVNSYIWPHLHKLQLTENMRARDDPEFIEYLLRVGNGTEPTVNNDCIQIPPSMLIRYTNDEDSIKQLTTTVFPDLSIFSHHDFSAVNCAILTTKNEFVDQINQQLIHDMSGCIQEYISRDKCIEDSDQTIMEDFINALTPNGFPPHKLILKPNTPIMLLRNIDPPQGLCNGTRLICKSLKSNVIYATISCGEFTGKEVFLHRICFRIENDPESPVSFERIQFPIRPCFAMTINKAQGQTLDFVGIYLREPVFSHGQLYVAMSRAKNKSSIKILIKPAIFSTGEDSITHNVVYREVLDLANE
nr:uncharacterized protein LOC113743677 [Coffea arabica]